MKKIHFIGIGGIGLSALALFLKEEGYKISGSDIKETPITKKLRENGCIITIPHNSNCIKAQDKIIYSAVIKEDNVEIVEANKQNIEIYSRADALKFILQDRRVYAVCGAHGKSTTSAMLSSILQCSMLIGAQTNRIGSNMYYKDAHEIVFEADESDGSFLNSNPYIAIVTNAEPEHMEYYNYNLDLFYKCYENFLKMAKIRVINAEDPFLKSLNYLDAIRLYPSIDITNIETIIKDNEPYTRFILKDCGEFEVWGIGDHIALDAALAILAANEIKKENIKENLLEYHGIQKRFDIVKSSKSLVIIDDYAHHPTEVKATLQSAFIYKEKMKLEKVIAIWQPHKYSRTIDNLEAFINCFEGVNELIILPVWEAGEQKVDINFEKHFKRYNPIFAQDIKQVDNIIAINLGGKYITIESGLVIGFGAGDITYQLR